MTSIICRLSLTEYIWKKLDIGDSLRCENEKKNTQLETLTMKSISVRNITCLVRNNCVTARARAGKKNHRPRFIIYKFLSLVLLQLYRTRRSCLDITVTGSPSPAASEDEDEGCATTGNAASNHSGNHRSNHGSAKKGRQKRGVLPKQATGIMRSWLFQHLVVSVERSIIFE